MQIRAIGRTQVGVAPDIQQPVRAPQADECPLFAHRARPGREAAVKQRALLLEVLIGYRELDDRDRGKHLWRIAHRDDRLLQDLVTGGDQLVVRAECPLTADRPAGDLCPELRQARQAGAEPGDGLRRACRGVGPDSGGVRGRQEGRDRAVRDRLLTVERRVRAGGWAGAVDDHLSAFASQRVLQIRDRQFQAVDHRSCPGQRQGGGCG